MKLAEIKNNVLKLLKLEQFVVVEGKHSLTEEQISFLNEKIDLEFAQKLLQALDAELVLQSENDESVKLIEELKISLAENEKHKETLQKQVDVLSNQPENEPVVVEIPKNKTDMKKFTVDASLKHNLVADNRFNGDGTRILAGDTIDVSELRNEFGKYIDTIGSGEIMKSLMQGIETTQYMTEKMAITEWRAAQAVITSVVQQFTPKWTPLTGGKTTFTPLRIYNRHHKINVPITPAEIVQDWIAFLYQENLKPSDMNITKYIINELIVPKVNEDRELYLLGKGVFSEVDPSGLVDGDPGQATGGSMDGFVTILKNEKSSGTSSMNFLLDGEVITEANIVDQINAFCDAVSPLYRNIRMNIFMSPEMVTMYKRAYQKLYPLTKNEDTNKYTVDFTNFTLVGLPSMVGESVFFATPKQNFIHLTNLNQGANKILIQEQNYDVKVFAEWWEGVGFAMAEAVFAYVPDEESGSGS